jgi:hypothetical protein
MKKSKCLTLAAVVANFVLSSQGQNYEYQVTAPISGEFQQGAADPGMQYQGVGYNFFYDTLSETVYYNPTANTVDQVGTVTLSSTSFIGTFEDDKTTSGGVVIPAVVSVDYTLNNGNNTIYFNSGVQSVGVNPAMTWSLPFTESITVTTGGQTYNDILSGTISEDNTITSVSQFSPASIEISQGYESLNQPIFDPDLSDTVNAADGWSATLVDAVGDGSLNETYYVSPVTAYATPEPGTLALFSVGAFGLKLLLRRCPQRMASV